MINKNTLTKPINKKVLLCSAGMDSYIIDKLEKPDVCLFIDSKSNYSEIEKKWMIENEVHYHNLVIMDNVLDLSMVELDNFIVPIRNLFFAAFGTYFGDDIILGATYGDRSSDKDYTFQGMMNGVLNYIYGKSHWCEGRNINFNLKYKEWTKEDLIKEFIKQGGDVEELVFNSFSCYTPDENEEPCGKCKPCIRKFLSILGATGVDISEYYDNKPRDYFTEEVIQQWIGELKVPVNRRGRESEETENVLYDMLEGRC
jgi:7-cyano-7-deazaguanine synthase in queuosine biosynthesis